MVIRTLHVPPLVVGETGPLYVQSSQSFNQIGQFEEWNSTPVPLDTKDLPLGTRHRVAEAIYSPDYDDTDRFITVPILADIYGPSPGISGAGTSGTDFTLPGGILGAATQASFNLVNADVLSSINSTWRSVIKTSPQLVRLSVLGMELSDPSGAFSLVGLPSTFVLNGNQSQTINVSFHPTTPGVHEAQLKLLTDVNAEVGQPGDLFTITLRGNVLEGDLNGDGSVDAADAGIMFGQWGNNPGVIGDINSDGFVDAADAGIMFGNWTGDASLTTLSIPEPNSWILTASFGLWLIGRTRSKPKPETMLAEFA